MKMRAGASAERRLKKGEKIVVASHNAGKVREINELIAPYGLEAVSAGELGLPEPEENGKTFAQNAFIKAIAAAKTAGLPALADDSGLEVDALDGDPGIYSARWGGPEKNFYAAMQKIEDLLVKGGYHGPDDRGANFTAALVLAWPDGERRTFEGKIFGRLVWPPRGEHGFGYDPVFVPEGHDITFGEMDPVKKNLMSHRGRAFKLFVDECFDDQ